MIFLGIPGPLHFKSEVNTIFPSFVTQVENQFFISVNIVRTDGGGEFVNKQFSGFLSSKGIIHQITPPYTPQLNGVVESKHRHVTETLWTLLTHASAPPIYWVEAILTSVYLINRMPLSLLAFLFPYQVLFNIPPYYANLRVFGCLCYPWTKPYTSSKLHTRSSHCVFLGYNMPCRYRCLDLASGRLYITRHVTFHETIFSFSSPCSSPPVSPPPASSSVLPTLFSLVPISSSSISTSSEYAPTVSFSSKPPALPISLSLAISFSFSLPPTPCLEVVLPPLSPPATISSSHSSSFSSSISSSESSSTLPNDHPMITRFKAGVTRPHIPLSLVATTEPVELTIMAQAMAHPL